MDLNLTDGNYFAVPRAEYAALVRASERLEVIGRLLKNVGYISKNELNTILDIHEDEDEDGDEDDAEE